METLKFSCEDGEVVEVKVEILSYFATIQNMIDLSNEGMEESGATGNNDEAIVLPGIKSTILHLAVEWATKHKQVRWD